MKGWHRLASVYLHKESFGKALKVLDKGIEQLGGEDNMLLAFRKEILKK